MQTEPTPYRAIIAHAVFVGAVFAFVFRDSFEAAALALVSLWLTLAIAVVHLAVIVRGRAKAATTRPAYPLRAESSTLRGDLPTFTLLTFKGVRPNGEGFPFSMDANGEEVVLTVQHTN